MLHFLRKKSSIQSQVVVGANSTHTVYQVTNQVPKNACDQKD